MNLSHLQSQTTNKVWRKSVKKYSVSRNDIFTSIKGHNSVVYKQIQPICNPKPLLSDINVHEKFEENWSKTTQVKSPEMKRWWTFPRIGC